MKYPEKSLSYLMIYGFLTGCVAYGGADPVTPIKSDIAENAYVRSVTVSGTSPDMSSDFDAVFIRDVSDRLKQCATGKTPLDLKVDIAEFHIRNIAKTFLIGDSNRIAGSAHLVDPTAGSEVADYDIQYSQGGGGLLTAVAMGGATDTLSRGFAKELCKRAFVER